VKHLESDLQAACVRWFRYQYPKYAKLLFSIPNGGYRNKVTAIAMKREGQVSGVSDLILLIPNTEYTALCIEMKTGKGKQTDMQREFQQAAELFGNRYVVCRNFEEFKTEIDNYINGIG